MRPEASAIAVEGLVKSYGRTAALRGLTMHAARGTVVCLMGPNGAGKTTVIRVLSTLTRPDGGTARVCGHDVVQAAGRVRALIGLTGQDAAVDEHLTAMENLWLFARLNGLARRLARSRVAELVEAFDLGPVAERPVRTYSGGLRRRVDLAAALVAAPPVLFVDEPTTGLDPRSRRTLWELIRARARAGSTILLTTQYLEEGDQLADRIYVVDQGRAVAEGTPDELKARIGGERIEVTLAHPAALPLAAAELETLLGGRPEVDAAALTVSVLTDDRPGVLSRAVRGLDEAGVDVTDVRLRRLTLDDVFFAFTGAEPAANGHRR
ncbi:ATP-binding cassette domain-containing protein [Nonomuraea sp. NPDC003727]